MAWCPPRLNDVKRNTYSSARNLKVLKNTGAYFFVQDTFFFSAWWKRKAGFFNCVCKFGIVQRKTQEIRLSIERLRPLSGGNFWLFRGIVWLFGGHLVVAKRISQPRILIGATNRVVRRAADLHGDWVQVEVVILHVKVPIQNLGLPCALMVKKIEMPYVQSHALSQS